MKRDKHWQMPFASAKFPGPHRRQTPPLCTVQSPDSAHVPSGRGTSGSAHMTHRPSSYTTQPPAGAQSVALRGTAPSTHDVQAVPLLAPHCAPLRQTPFSKTLSGAHDRHPPALHRAHPAKTLLHRTQPLSASGTNASSHATAPLCAWAVAFAISTHPPCVSDVPAVQTEHGDTPSVHNAHDVGHSPHTSPDAKCVSAHFTT